MAPTSTPPPLPAPPRTPPHPLMAGDHRSHARRSKSNPFEVIFYTCFLARNPTMGELATCSVGPCGAVLLLGCNQRWAAACGGGGSWGFAGDVAEAAAGGGRAPEMAGRPRREGAPPRPPVRRAQAAEGPRPPRVRIDRPSGPLLAAPRLAVPGLLPLLPRQDVLQAPLQPVRTLHPLPVLSKLGGSRTAGMASSSKSTGPGARVEMGREHDCPEVAGVSSA